MIFSKTPYRISFCGGGTDYEEWLQQGNEGIVVGATIDKYSYLLCRKLPPFFGYKTRVAYSSIETVYRNSDICHNAIRNTIQSLGLDEEPLEISHISDLPSFSGLGTSSAFIVGLYNALNFLKNNSPLSCKQLAEKAIYIEQELMKEVVGRQDQSFAAFGGIKIFIFKKDTTENYNLGLKENQVKDLENHLLLFFTQIPRKASKIASTLQFDIHQMNQMKELAYKAITAIQNSKWQELGEIINKSWKIKKDMSDLISNHFIDEYYKVGMEHGAFGGKILGAGGGGMMLFIAPPENHQKIIDNVDMLHIPIKISFGGSEIEVLND